MNQPIELSEINIVPVKPQNGLLGFCTFVVDKKFYIGSVAIFSKREGGIRLVYPKKGGIDAFHPIKKEVGDYITNMVEKQFYNLKFNEQQYEYTRGIE